MIPLTEAPSPVTMSAGMKSSNYSIALTGKTFDVLSSMLYKDPHLAIVRELSCNAYDSHVENGCVGTAFDIHLPNKLEPFFSIRDYGTGMSSESIDKVYTKFFESTKTHTNDQVGALGLGSKSPFAYTSNYTITSWHGGLKLVYSAFKTTAGIPAITLLDVSDTTEPSGLEVMIAVKAIDFDKFTSKVQAFFTTWTSVPPKILGGLEGRTTLRHVAREFGGSDWFIASTDSPLNRAIAIQGNVPYPLARDPILESNIFRDRFPGESDERTPIKELLNLPIVITYPIGQLDFSASREELQYTEPTVAAILDKLVLIKNDIAAHIQSKFDTLPTQWDVVKTCRELRADRFLPIIKRLGSKSFVWKNKPLNIESYQLVAANTAKVKAALALHSLRVQSNKRRKFETIPLLQSVFDNGVATEVVNPDIVFQPPPRELTVVIFDEPKLGDSKVRFNFTSRSIPNNGSIITISSPRGTQADPVTFKSAVSTLLEAFDIVGSYASVVYASTLKAPPPTRQLRSTTGIVDTFKLFIPNLHATVCPNNYSDTGWKAIGSADLDTQVKSGKYKQVVYVPIFRGVPLFQTPDGLLRETSAPAFAVLWDTILPIFKENQVLLVGIKQSALDKKHVKAFTQTVQSLDSFLRFWFYEHAEQIINAVSYPYYWSTAKNGHIHHVLITALAGSVTQPLPLLTEAAAIAKLFVNAPLPTKFAASIVTTIGAMLCDLDNNTDPVLADIMNTKIAVSNDIQLKFDKLHKLCDQITTEFPMLGYLQAAMRYGIPPGISKNACNHVQQYLKLVTV